MNKDVWNMSNSSLVCCTKLSPCKDSPRNHVIDTITVHCMSKDYTVEACGELFQDESRETSSNYGIGSDGRIALYVDESDRSWCSSNRDNDHRAIPLRWPMMVENLPVGILSWRLHVFCAHPDCG